MIEGSEQMKLSLVVPCYNEEENVGRLYDEVVKTFEDKQIEYEIIFINDGSKDNTFKELKKILKLLIFLVILVKKQLCLLG